MKSGCRDGKRREHSLPVGFQGKAGRRAGPTLARLAGDTPEDIAEIAPQAVAADTNREQIFGLPLVSTFQQVPYSTSQNRPASARTSHPIYPSPNAPGFPALPRCSTKEHAKTMNWTMFARVTKKENRWNGRRHRNHSR